MSAVVKAPASTKAEPTLSISPEKLGYIIVKAREFDVKDVVTDPDSSSNVAADAMLSVLEDHSDDPVHDEFMAFIGALNEDEQIDLVALTWLGRGDDTIDAWEDLRAEGAWDHNKHTASYLLGMPNLPDHLEDGLAQFGISCEDYEMRR